MGGAFRKHVRRLGFILLVAYYLHLPHFGLSRFLLPQNQAFWKGAFQVDVLQCIVVSLLALDAVLLLARRPAPAFWATAILAAGASAATPWIWAHDFSEQMPLFLAMFLNPHGRSLFPLFPWIAFVCAGGCVAHLYLRALERKEDARFMRRAALAAALAIVAAVLARDSSYFRSWHGDFFTTSPLYVVVRLGCVLILCAGLHFLEKERGWAPGAIRLAGQESLLVYAGHLLLLFSVLRRPPVADVLGRQAGYAACLALSAVLIVVMLWLARLWHDWKRSRPRLSRGLLAGAVAVSLITFLLR
jgi:hypothetical protein